MKTKHLMNSGMVLASMLFATSAYSADGCKFLLCMGAPNPMGISECVGTVKEVLHDLKKGKGFPSCTLSSGKDSKSEGTWVAYRRANYVPDCPEGYREGNKNIIYHTGAKPANARNRTFYSGGLQSDYNPEYNEDSWVIRDGYKSRVCIAGSSNGSIPSYSYSRRVDGDNERVNVPTQEWVDKAVLMTPDGASYDFTMFTDNKPYSKHRF